MRFGSLPTQTRRGVAPGTIKNVAQRMASKYADGDGTRIFPGVARLAVDLELHYDTVRDALAVLREVGLIRLVRAASTPGNSDEYQLTLPTALTDDGAGCFGDGAEHGLQVWSPSHMDVVIERVRAKHRGRYPGASRHRHLQGRNTPAAPPDEPTPAGVNHPLSPVENPDLQRSITPAEPDPPPIPAGVISPRTDRPAGVISPDLQGSFTPATHHVPTTEPTHHDQLKVEDQLTVIGAHDPDAKPVHIRGGGRFVLVPRPTRPGEHVDPPDIVAARYRRGRALVEHVLNAKARGEPDPLTELATVIPLRRPA